MNSLGWRFLVLADLGTGAKGPVALRVGDPEGWMKPLSARVSLTPPGASGPVTLEFPDEKALRPEGLPAAAGDAEEILRDPSFLRVESALLGLKLLAGYAGADVRIEVLSAPPEELVARFHQTVFEPEMSSPRAPALTLILADSDFSHMGPQFTSLSSLAEMARDLQAPLVAGTSPAFFGLKQIGLLPKLPDLPRRLAGGAHAAWQKFQKEEAARWVTLTVNRYLQREPHPGETFDPDRTETLPWGRGGWLVAAAAARSIRNHGHPLEIAGVPGGLLSGLPTRPYPKLANRTVPLTTEVEIPEQAADQISRAGFVPVCGRTGSDVALIPRAVNVHRGAPGRLTVSGTLEFQLFNAHVARYCSLLLSRIAEAGPDPAAFLKKSLADFLGPLVGKDPQSAVSVTLGEVKDAEGRPRPVAEVVVRPRTRIEGMEFQMVFQLPLRACEGITQQGG